MNWAKRWTHTASTLALAGAIALPTAAVSQQPQNQQPNQQQPNQQQQDKQQQKEQKEKKAEKKDDVRKLQVFKLKHRTPQQMNQIVSLAEQAESDEQLNLNVIGQYANVAAARRVAGYRGAPADANKDNGDAMVIATDEAKKILFVRGSEEQLSKVKKLVDAFDVEQQEMKRHTLGKLSLIPVSQQDAAQIRSTLSQLELESGMLHMGETTLIVFHDDGDQEKMAQAEQVIEALCEDEKAAGEKKKKKNADDQEQKAKDAEAKIDKGAEAKQESQESNDKSESNTSET